MKLSNAFFLFLAALFYVNAHAQTPAESHRKILQSIENRDYQTAARELEDIRSTDKQLFESNNYDYLAARVAEKLDDFATAAANFQAVVNRDSILKPYALWHLARVARGSGNLLLERTYLQELLTYAPDGLTADAARARLARGYFESKNYEAAIRAFGDLQPAIGAQNQAANSATALEKTPRYRENLVFLGEAYLQSGKTEQAREVFTKLVSNLANPAQPDDFALAGAKGLDRLETGERFGTTVAALTDLQHVQRAAIYQFNRDFADARLHYQAIIKNHPQSGLVTDAIYQTGRGYAQEANFAEAINWFERVIERFPEHPAARDALTQAASAYARVGKPREAVTRYQKFIEKYPDAENLDRAYLNMIDVLRDAGEDSEALKWTARTQEAFRGRLPEAIALFSRLRIRLAQSDWQNALADADKLLTFADLGGTRVPGGTNRAEITFLKAFALENLERFQEAVPVYLSIPDGRSEYYGWRATERLKLLGATPKAASVVGQKIEELTAGIEARSMDAQRKAAQDVLRLTNDAETAARMIEIVKKTYAALPDYQKVPNLKLIELGRREVLREKRPPAVDRNRALADELLFLGLYDEGTPELEKSLKSQPVSSADPKSEIRNPKSDIDFTLAVLYKRGEMAHRAVAFIEPLWRSVPADYLIELMPREQAELLYPAPYADALLKHAPARGVDPRYALSIMRQESRYRADVKSVAAARGLMQFISTTSNQIARELKLENFRQDELYHPPTAVLFGAQYLANLYRMFPGQHAAVAASYNGGEDNMRRWLLRSKSDAPDRYVPEIVFSQSKDYVYRVLANYRVYQTFYDENLRAKQF